MSRASCGRSLLKTSINLSNLACCCRKFAAAGLVASFFRVRCMRSWRPFCWGCPGFIRSMAMPKRSHHTASLLRLNKACAEGEGHAIVAADVRRQAALFKKSLKHRKSKVFFGGGERLADQQIPAGMIGDRQRVAVMMIPQQELALVIGAPQFIGTLANG